MACGSGYWGNGPGSSTGTNIILDSGVGWDEVGLESVHRDFYCQGWNVHSSPRALGLASMELLRPDLGF